MNHKYQQGVILIGVLAFLFLIGITVTVSMQLSGNASSSVYISEYSTQALFIAESGLERAKSRFSQGDGCLALARDPATGYHNVGTGGFAVLTAVEPAPGYCTLSVEGVVNQVVRSINATIRLDGQSNLVEHFPSLADYSANWTTTSTNGLGAVGWGADNCPIAICTTSNPASGSLVFETNVASDAAIFQAGVKRALTNPFETGPAGMSGAINIAIKKDVLKATALTNEVYIYLTDSAGGFADLIFTDLRRTTPSKRWEYINQVLTFPANRTYDGISIVVNLAENATPRNNSVLAQIDVLEILGTSGTGGALILDWSE